MPPHLHGTLFARARLHVDAGAHACDRLGSAKRRAAVWLELSALVAVAFILGRALGPARYGTPDSASYLSAAEHLLRGDGYVTSELDDYGHFAALSCFAPLFSLLIASCMALGTSAQDAIADVVLGSFVLYGLACLALLKQVLPVVLRRAGPLLVLCLLCSPGSVTCLRAALSDLLGAALVLFACARLLSLRADDAAWTCGLLFGLSVLARWSNLYLVVGACCGVLIAARSIPLRVRVQRVLRVGMGTLVLTAPLWLRNFVLTGTVMGRRPSAPSSLLLHLERAFSGVAQPLLDAHMALLTVPWLAWLHALSLAFCATFVVVRWVRQRDERSDLGVCLVLGYAALLVLSSARTRFDSLTHPRFWLPLAPLLLGLSLRALTTLRAPRHGRQTWAPTAVVGWILFAHVSLRGVAAVSAQGVPARSGVFAQRFAASDVVRTAIALADRGQCALAATQAFWLYPQIGTRPVVWLPDTTRVVRRVEPTCVVLLREQVEYNTDGASFQERMQRLSRRSRAHLVLRDELAELWLKDARDD